MPGSLPRVLFTAAEAFPTAEAGGLGDVARELPVALRRLGVDARLMMPGYPSAMQQARDATTVARFDDVSGLGPAEILFARTIRDDLPIWFVRSQRFFDPPGGPYVDPHGAESADDLERFAMFCNAVALFVASSSEWRPTLVHANDWHCGLVPSLLRAHHLSEVASLLTIHNAAYQGATSPDRLHAFGVPAEQLSALPQGAHSFLGLGARFADAVSTVSPTYAREVLSKRSGCGLERVLRARSNPPVGILNGVDYAIWDPARDEATAATYDARDLLGKARCRAALLDEMRLETASFAPLLGVVSRLTWQKGLDLVVSIADVLVTAGARLIVLGRGDIDLQDGFRALATRYPRRVASVIGQDAALARRIIAGADIFLMPSRLEPCGLGQMCSLRYGTVPVVAAVGGLADSVVDAGQKGIDKGVTTGFTMRRFGPVPLTLAVGKAMAVYPDRRLWMTLQRNGMRQDFSWYKAAQQYEALYAQLAPPKGQPVHANP